ncbi:syndecan-2-like [Cheilinus undulatus]|uniref:syndecan-2-like n=1 Tax=Cheilinus undulatus TaxID=241271 RepID=UPI001BD3B238|nr:syndecan-2-like [Cheilinus undulatus]
MRIFLTVSIFTVLVLKCPVKTSFPGSPEDLEGSGYDLESSASGSGDWSENGENDNTEDAQTLAEDTDDGGKNPSHGSPLMTSDETQLPSEDSYIILASKKSLLENKDVVHGVIAGGVTGGILAAAVAALLIYRWQKRDEEAYILGQRRSSEEDYH